MNNATKFEQRASSSRCMHVGESSRDLCDRLSRTRDTSQRQLPTDHDYAASTREYQTDQSSLKPAPTAAGSVLDKRKKQRQQQKQPRGFAGVDRVTPYQVSVFLAPWSSSPVVLAPSFPCSLYLPICHFTPNSDNVCLARSVSYGLSHSVRTHGRSP